MSSFSTTVAVEELVSVIVPVRNGAPTLQLVLEGLLRQTYGNIEVLISDNASTDATADICQALMKRDGRIRYFRQPQLITASANFRYWVDKARGRFVLYAAHDDLRNRDFVRALVAAAQAQPDAVCLVPAVSSFRKYAGTPFDVVEPIPEPVAHYSTKGAGIWRRLGFVVFNGFPFYGLLRRDLITEYPWLEIEYAPDAPVIVFLALSGEIAVVNEAVLYYWAPERPKSPAERAVANSLKRLRPFPEARLAWVCSSAVSRAMAKRRVWMPRVAGFVAVYVWRRWPHVKQAVYTATPPGFRSAWRQLKLRLGWRLN